MFIEVLGRSFEIKVVTKNVDVGDKKQVKVPNRIITVTSVGFEYEPDIRQVGLTMKEFDACHSILVKTPW